MTREDFIREKPVFSIALDGYVKGKPFFERKGPYANFNHHEDVDRLSTRSTCYQVYVAIKQGLFNTFKEKGQPHANLYENDADQDVCLSTWLLKNSERIHRTKSEPLITRLVGVQELLDATAGTYPIEPNTKIMHELAWIFEPYTDSRIGGRVQHMDAPEMRNIIEAVCKRISDYTINKGEKKEPDTRYESVGGGTSWAMIKEHGYYARSALFARGISSFVSVRENGDGTFSYSIGKVSPYVDFPIECIYKRLNKIEAIADENTNRWGGGDTIGGSPRIGGSKLSPKDLEKIINETLQFLDIKK